MLGIGAAGGAALGPGPEPSLAGSGEVARRIPTLLALLAARERAEALVAAQAAAGTSPAPATTATVVRPRKHKAAAAPASSTSGTSTTPASSEGETGSSSTEAGRTPKKKLPAITNVWLVELSGSGFAGALAAPGSAPYLDQQAVPQGTLLSGWSALEGGAFAGAAALAEPPAAGAAPPLLHTLVQPPCPEGAAGAACAPETPGQIAAADTFLKETLATITSTPLYKEHGLVVVTFATVAVATQAGLPAGTSSSTLTYAPPSGVLLLSPFVRAGSRSSVTFDTTSPRQSLQALLH